MTDRIKKTLIKEDITVFDAMQRMSEASLKVLFLTEEEEKLIATISDGDIRRWILSQGDLHAPVERCAHYSPLYLLEEERRIAMGFMRKNGIEAVPIVDSEMRIVDVIAWHDPAWRGADETIHAPVIMMAGGRGSRLYPYTKILPKPLIPIGEIPISEHIINQFHRQGCNQFYLVVNHKKNMIKAYYNEIEKDYQVEYVDEEIPLGTGGGLSLLKGAINETCILTNCDILIQESISRILKHHKEQNNKITMICSAKSFHIPYGVVHIQNGGGIDYMEEKPDISFFTNTGCYIIEPEVIEEMPERTEIGFPDIINRYKDAGDRVGVYPISENSWLDMGQMDELEKMRNRIEESIE